MTLADLFTEDADRYVYVVEYGDDDERLTKGVYEDPTQAVFDWERLAAMHGMKLDPTTVKTGDMLRAENHDPEDGDWHWVTVNEHELNER